jgi:ribosomal-protein-serine acetyltransferase
MLGIVPQFSITMINDYSFWHGERNVVMVWTSYTRRMEPLLLDLPSQFETQRLIIRAYQAGDGAALHAAVAESLEQLRPWLRWATHVMTPVEHEIFVRRKQAEFIKRDDLSMTMWLPSGSFVGAIGLHNWRWDVPATTIGYWVRTSLTRQGYMSEAVNGLTDFAVHRIGARRVQILVDDRNEPSWRVAERCGFTLEGTLRNEGRNVQGDLRHMRVYARTG